MVAGRGDFLNVFSCCPEQVKRVKRNAAGPPKGPAAREHIIVEALGKINQKLPLTGKEAAMKLFASATAVLLLACGGEPCAPRGPAADDFPCTQGVIA